jgi:hypothetical protein
VLVPETKRIRVCIRHGHCRTERVADTTVRLGWHQAKRVIGLLVVNGQPAAGAQISVIRQPQGNWPAEQLGSVTTDSAGQFSYTIHGPTGEVIFQYGGTPSVRATSAVQQVQARGHIVLRAPKRFVPGRSVRVSGWVQGGYVPSGGVLVQLWWNATGDPYGWQPFGAPVRTNSSGRWRVTLPVPPGAAGHTYWLKARISHQPDWPWLGTTTAPLTRSVS